MPTGGIVGAEASWWQRGVFYQIYPRSFQDANADGVGDLPGIISRLDYLNDGTPRSLGVDAIWLSPTFPSPMADFGYDVSDYVGVHPLFGTLDDMDRLIAECHRRGIRVLLDYVPNHSSDQHPWFIESRRGRDDPKRDWYYWRDAKADGSPPNNWVGAFGGGAWEWDEPTGQFYLHSFLKEQPDLNWRNPAVVAAMHEALRFWLQRGIDGFRIDVMGMVLKDPAMRDNPPNPDYRPADGAEERASQLWLYNRNWPDVFDAVRGIRRVVDEFPDRMVVGEVFGDSETLAAYYGGPALDGLHLAFNFRLIRSDGADYTAWDAAVFRAIVDAAEGTLPRGAWPNYVLGNHDRPRPTSRLGGGTLGQARARAAAVLLLTLRGTPFIYYGDEIGMEDVPVTEAQAQDPARFHGPNRDPARTPMQWENAPGAGFSTAAPWLPFGDLRTNVLDQDRDPDSLLSLYRRLIWLRRRSPALREGSYRPLDSVAAGVFAFLRQLGSERLLCAVNFAADAGYVDMPDLGAGAVACSSNHGRERERVLGRLSLAANEGCVVRLD